jgi:hypothetical protein
MESLRRPANKFKSYFSRAHEKHLGSQEHRLHVYLSLSIQHIGQLKYLGTQWGQYLRDYSERPNVSSGAINPLGIV